MRLEGWLLKTVAFVGIETQRKEFIPTGTGFLVVKAYGGFQTKLLVTARHVIEQMRGDSVFVRLNRNLGGADIARIPKEECFFHPSKEVDLAIVPCHFSDDVFDCTYYRIDRTEREDWLSTYGEPQVGDETAVVGLYTSQYGQTRNEPVARFGNIAGFPSEPVWGKQGFMKGFLIETRTIGGLSGSPVFYVIPPVARANGRVGVWKRADYLPIGILVGYHGTASKADEITAPEYQNGLPTGGPPNTLVERNTGFGIVIPFDRVVDIVEGEAFMQRLQTSVEADKS